jgi:hypothetical protein
MLNGAVRQEIDGFTETHEVVERTSKDPTIDNGVCLVLFIHERPKGLCEVVETPGFMFVCDGLRGDEDTWVETVQKVRGVALEDHVLGIGRHNIPDPRGVLWVVQHEPVVKEPIHDDGKISIRVAEVSCHRIFVEGEDRVPTLDEFFNGGVVGVVTDDRFDASETAAVETIHPGGYVVEVVSGDGGYDDVSLFHNDSMIKCCWYLAPIFCGCKILV